MTEKTGSISVRLSAIGDLCASCTLVHRVQFKQKRCFKAFFFLDGRKYGRTPKTAFYVGSVRKFGCSMLEYSD